MNQDVGVEYIEYRIGGNWGDRRICDKINFTPVLSGLNERPYLIESACQLYIFRPKKIIAGEPIGKFGKRDDSSGKGLWRPDSHPMIGSGYTGPALRLETAWSKMVFQSSAGLLWYAINQLRTKRQAVQFLE